MCDNCSICYDNITVIQKTKLDCGHIFHQDCLDKWYIVSPTCPLCRAKIRDKKNMRYQIIFISTLFFKFIEKYYPELNFTPQVQNIIEARQKCYDECEQELYNLILKSKQTIKDNCCIILFRILTAGIFSIRVRSV